MNMLKAIFTDGVDEITVHGLTQWDKGQTLQITHSSLPASFQVHFANKRSDTAYVVKATATNGVATVEIPNLILHHRSDAVAWVYLSDGDSGETVKTINLPIQARAKPEGYAYTEVEILDYRTLDKRIDALERGGGGGSGGGSAATIGYATLLSSGWVGNASPYSQVVEIEGVTVNSQVDLTPSVEQLAIFYNKDLSFVTENEDGVVTVYAIGQKPENDYTIQVTITEVYV